MNKTLRIILIITFLSLIIIGSFINCYNSSHSKMSSSPNKRQRLTPVLKSSTTSKTTSSINEDNTLIKLLSWNIDGIRDENLESDNTKQMRIMIITSILLAEKPDIILLQENTLDMYSIIKHSLEIDYNDIEENKPKIGGYFTSIFVRKEKNYKINHQRLSFAGVAKSNMGRDLNIATITLKNEKKISLMTSHLESLKDFENTRKSQLQIGLEILVDSDSDYGILCGDLNIRDQEAKEVLKTLNSMYILPKGKSAIEDAWVTCGSNINEKFTWTGKPFGNVNWNARYDRILYTNVDGITPVDFKLIGKDTVEDSSTTQYKGPLEPSDHFGLLCSFMLDTSPNRGAKINRLPSDPFSTP